MLNIQIWWPIAVIVLSNIFYQICAKEAPAQMHPFAGLTITYMAAAATCAILYKFFSPNGLFSALKDFSFTYLLFGLALVGLEAGSIYMYKLGWPLSIGQIVHSSLLSVCLVFIGYVIYHEPITVSKILGISAIFFWNLLIK